MPSFARHHWLGGLLAATLPLLAACAEQDAASAQQLLSSTLGQSGLPYASQITKAGTAVSKVAVAADISPEREKQLGDAAAAEILKTQTISKDEALRRHLDRMTQKIARKADPVPFTYTVYLVEDPEPNAFTPGAGHVFVTTGLVKVLETEAQMAMVLSHEMAHVTKNHLLKGQLHDTIVAEAGSLGSDYLTSKTGVTRAVPPQLLNAVVKRALDVKTNGYSRDLEAQADDVGYGYMTAAGYDPHESVKVFEIFARFDGPPSHLQNFFEGNHPLAVDRARALQARLKDYAPTGTPVVDTPEYAKLTKAYRAGA